jgi:serine/threonine protein kinase
MRRRKLRAGAVLSFDGNSACVISPPLPGCGGGDVSKVFKLDDDAENRAAFARETDPDLLATLGRIDPHNLRFIYATHTACAATPLDDEQQEDVRRCTRRSVQNTQDVVYFNMPFAISRDGRLSVQQRLFLSDSIDILHENNISHGDLHDRNVMMGADTNPRIIDFGLSHVNASQEQKDVDSRMFAENFPVIRERGPPPEIRGRRRREMSPGSPGRRYRSRSRD